MSDYKQITFENWTQPDPAIKHFICIQSDGTSREIIDEEYLIDILSYKLDSSVPEEICKLFEVAQGAMTYGCYYYPIFSLASEQLFRILESSVAISCKLLGSPRKLKKYNEHVQWLIKKGIVKIKEKKKWDAARKLRNSRSHLKNQMILPPGNAISILSEVTHDINTLFFRVKEYQENK